MVKVRRPETAPFSIYFRFCNVLRVSWPYLQSLPTLWYNNRCLLDLLYFIGMKSSSLSMCRTGLLITSLVTSVVTSTSIHWIATSWRRVVNYFASSWHVSTLLFAIHDIIIISLNCSLMVKASSKLQIPAVTAAIHTMIIPHTCEHDCSG